MTSNVTNWQRASIEKDIRLFTDMLEYATNKAHHADARRISGELRRLRAILRDMNGEPEIDDDTPAFGMPPYSEAG